MTTTFVRKLAGQLNEHLQASGAAMARGLARVQGNEAVGLVVVVSAEYAEEVQAVLDALEAKWDAEPPF